MSDYDSGLVQDAMGWGNAGYVNEDSPTMYVDAGGNVRYRPTDWQSLLDEGVYTPFNPLYGRGKRGVADRLLPGEEAPTGTSRETWETGAKMAALMLAAGFGGIAANEAMAGSAGAAGGGLSSEPIATLPTGQSAAQAAALQPISAGGVTAGGVAGGGTAAGGLTANSIAPLAVGPSAAQGAAIAPIATSGGGGVTLSAGTAANGGLGGAVKSWWSALGKGAGGSKWGTMAKLAGSAAMSGYSSYKQAQQAAEDAKFRQDEAKRAQALEADRIHRLRSGPLSRVAPFLMQQALNIYAGASKNRGGGLDMDNIARLMGFSDLSGMKEFHGWDEES